MKFSCHARLANTAPVATTTSLASVPRARLASRSPHRALELNPVLPYIGVAPRRIRLPDGADAMIIEGRPVSRIGVTTMTGVPRDQWANRIMTFDTAAGAGSPEQRVREQDQDGVDAEVLFNFPQINFWRPSSDAA